jgi:hypothetical protein
VLFYARAAAAILANPAADRSMMRLVQALRITTTTITNITIIPTDSLL